MNRTTVPSEVREILEQLSRTMESMSPQLRKGAAYVLDHPEDVGFSSVRELAALAGVKPNTLVRMARALSFDGFDDFREPFRQQLRMTGNPFPDRAAWLQELAAEGHLGSLYAAIAQSALTNLELLFDKTTADDFKRIADAVMASRRTFVIGVGANLALAHNFSYLASMAIDHVIAVPDRGNGPMDAIVRAGPADLVITMTFEPYRSEVVEASAAAQEQGATLVAITDSHGSPIAIGADHVIIAPAATPQFFPSTAAASVALETLASFIVADAPTDVVAAIDRFHQRRYDLGVYWRGDS